MADDRDYLNQGCVNVALIALLLLPYALIRHGIAQYRARRAARGPL